MGLQVRLLLYGLAMVATPGSNLDLTFSGCALHPIELWGRQFSLSKTSGRRKLNAA